MSHTFGTASALQFTGIQSVMLWLGGRQACAYIITITILISP